MKSWNQGINLTGTLAKKKKKGLQGREGKPLVEERVRLVDHISGNWKSDESFLLLKR